METENERERERESFGYISSQAINLEHKHAALCKKEKETLKDFHYANWFFTLLVLLADWSPQNRFSFQSEQIKTQ